MGVLCTCVDIVNVDGQVMCEQYCRNLSNDRLHVKEQLGETEREKDSVCVRERERETVFVCVCVCVCVCV